MNTPDTYKFTSSFEVIFSVNEDVREHLLIWYTRIRPVLVKHMIILASYVNKWTFILEKYNLIEWLPQRRHFWPNPKVVCMTVIARDEF